MKTNHPFTFEVYTNPQGMRAYMSQWATKRKKLWNGEEMVFEREDGQGHFQSFVKDDMHFYRIKWSLSHPFFNVFLEEEEDKEYIDLCVNNKGSATSVLVGKKRHRVFNNTQGDVLQVFCKKDIIDLPQATLKEKLREVPQGGKIVRPLHEILDIFPSGNNNALKLESKFLELAHNYLEHLHQPISKAPKFLNQHRRDQIQEVHEFLAEHYVNPPSLEYLARHFGINRDHLQVGFKHMFQTTIRRHVIALKLKKAKSLLQQTDMPTVSVADTVGYANYGHFVKLYRQQFKVNPSEERS